MVVSAKTISRLGERWLPLLLWMAAIFIASSRTKAEIPSFGLWDQLLKKIGHFLAYALMAWLAWRGTHETTRPYLWAFLITVFYAVSDEWHQSFVPTRNGSQLDVFIDAMGGLLMLTLLYRRQHRSSLPPPSS
jgi:VanZ family protein